MYVYNNVLYNIIFKWGRVKRMREEEECRLHGIPPTHVYEYTRRRGGASSSYIQVYRVYIPSIPSRRVMHCTACMYVCLYVCMFVV